MDKDPAAQPRVAEQAPPDAVQYLQNVAAEAVPMLSQDWPKTADLLRGAVAQVAALVQPRVAEQAEPIEKFTIPHVSSRGEVFVLLQDVQQAAPEAPARPELTVWYGAMPESNGRSNFTATLKRKDADMFDTDSYTFARSEYPDRVRYEADCMRHLIGELAERPDILAYDADKHSGYVAPAPATPAAPSDVPARYRKVLAMPDGPDVLGPALKACRVCGSMLGELHALNCTHGTSTVVERDCRASPPAPMSQVPAATDQPSAGLGEIIDRRCTEVKAIMGDPWGYNTPDRINAARYERLRILGAAPGGSKQLSAGTVLCFQNLDDFVDADLDAHPSRGEARAGQVDERALTDYEIECLWSQHADSAKAGERRIAFGRAVEAAVLARASLTPTAPQAPAEPVRHEYRLKLADGSTTPWRDTSKERAAWFEANPAVEGEDEGSVYEVRALIVAPTAPQAASQQAGTGCEQCDEGYVYKLCPNCAPQAARQHAECEACKGTGYYEHKGSDTRCRVCGGSGIAPQAATTASASGEPSDPFAQVRTNAAMWEKLAEAIHNAAVKAGIIKEGTAVTGPDLLMLCDDLARAALARAPLPAQAGDRNV